MSEIRVQPVDTLTGKPFMQEVGCSAASWTRTMGGSGDGSFTIPTARLDRAEVQRIARGWATTMVVECLSGSPVAGTPEYAGLVQSVDWDGITLTVHTKELPIILTKRQLFGVQPGPVTRTYQGAALADVIVQLIRTVYLGGSTRWNLPLSTGPWNPYSNAVVRTFDWWRFLPAVDALKSLTDEAGAPLWDMRPYWNVGTLGWRLYVGDLEGGVVDLPVSTPEYPVKSGAQVSVTRDWQAQLTGVITIGTGQEDAIRWGRSGSMDMTVADAIPWLDATESWIQVEDVNRLNVLARGKVAEQRYGVDQWTVTVQCDDELTPTMLRPGTEARLIHPGDKLVSPGTYRQRVLSVTGDLTMKRTLTVQEVR